MEQTTQTENTGRSRPAARLVAARGRKTPAQNVRLRVLLIRHAIAEDRVGGKSDASRALTHSGRKKMKKAVRGLEGLVGSIDLIATSPLVRAVQTAEIVAERFRKVRTVRLGSLAPGKPAGQVMHWLAEAPAGSLVALVGHEPDLGTFASWTLTGLRDSFMPLKKGGACLVEFDREVRPGRGKLVWVLKPSQLRNLA